MAFEMKFSDAISWIEDRCRTTSFLISSASSGSTCSIGLMSDIGTFPAPKRVLASVAVRGQLYFLPEPRWSDLTHGTVTEDQRRWLGEIDDRRSLAPLGLALEVDRYRIAKQILGIEVVEYRLVPREVG